MKTILGYDCSSSCIGFCILHWNELTNEIDFVKMGYLKPIKDGTIIERLADTRNKIQQIIKDTQPDYIAIEEIIQFMAKKSNAKSVIMLATFNRMIGLCAYDYLGKSPEMHNVLSIRHGLKLTKIIPKKENMPSLIEHHLNIKFPYLFKKSGKIAVESYDQSDGCAVALYQAFILSGKIKKKPKTTKKVKKKK